MQGITIGSSQAQSAQDDQTKKRRRPRQRFSCVPCQRRKTKCDKEQPCESCIKRETVNECKWEEPVLDPATIAEDLAAELQSVRRRLARVETRMQEYERGAAKSEFSRSVNFGSPTQSQPFAAQTPTSSLTSGFPERPNMQQHLSEENEIALVLESLATSNNMIAPSSFGKEISGVPQVRLGHEPPTWTSSADEAQRKELLPASPILPGAGMWPTIRRQIPSSNPSKRSRILVSAPMEFVPARELTDALVAIWFSDLGWIHNCMHSPTFTAQCAELYALQTSDVAVEVDPAWMAVYYLVLAWSISYRLPQGISTDQARDMANDWHAAAQASLHASEWSLRPRIWAVQAMILNMYFRNGLVATQRSDLITVYTWLSPAIRLAQLLGLHRLGNDPSRMPADDPAFPPGRSAIKRETAKRIWSYLLTSDWLTCTHNGYAQIPPDTFDTDRPLLLLDEDMTPDTEFAEERPASHLTDTTFVRIQRLLANFQITAYRCLRSRDKKYSTVLELESMLQAELDRLDLINSYPSRRLLPYLVSLARSVLNNRILRLHRPFFIVGWHSIQYASSTSTCLRCATNISTALETLAHTPIEGLWYLRTHAMGAGLVHFMDLYRETQGGLTGPRLTRKVSNFIAVRDYFERTSGGPSNRASPHLVFDALLSAIFPHGPQAPPMTAGTLPPLPDLLHAVTGQHTSAGGRGPMPPSMAVPLQGSTGPGPGSRSSRPSMSGVSPQHPFSPHAHHQLAASVSRASLSSGGQTGSTGSYELIQPQHAGPSHQPSLPPSSLVGPATTLPAPPGAFDDLDAGWNALWEPTSGAPELSPSHLRDAPSGAASEAMPGMLTDWSWILTVGGASQAGPTGRRATSATAGQMPQQQGQYQQELHL